MSTEGLAFIRLARARPQCGLPKLDDALDRSAISRAYYGAFWCVRDWVERRFKVHLDGLNVHGEVRRYLRDAGLSDAAEHLERLHTRRKEADYDTGVDFDVDDALALANRVVSSLPTL
jgi:uncharacterized protein (UPF0332 family)